MGYGITNGLVVEMVKEGVWMTPFFNGHPLLELTRTISVPGFRGVTDADRQTGNNVKLFAETIYSVKSIVFHYLPIFHLICQLLALFPDYQDSWPLGWPLDGCAC